MKKIFLTFLGLFLSTAAFAQEPAQEVTYVEDPAQGYLFNRFRDNWFITAEVGGNIYFSPEDQHRDWTDRFDPAASIYVGKWFSPIIGLRTGLSWLQVKGLAQNPDAPGIDWSNPMVNGKYKQQFNHFGPVFDVMLNLTNWWRGYIPDRKYSLVLYLGGGGYWTWGRKYDGPNHEVSLGYCNLHDRVITFRAGLINSWRVSDHWQLGIDIRYSGIDNHVDEYGLKWNKTSHDLQGYLTATYLFHKREWSAPVVPVCPEPENCDPIREQHAAALGKIADLEDELAHCCEKCPKEEIVEEGPLATIYYPINVSKLTRKDILMLQAVAEVMKAHPAKKYMLTGWADNYTGNNTINVRLRNNRVDGVKKQLIKLGVPEYQLESQINNGNLCDLGSKYVALDRATTIEELK